MSFYKELQAFQDGLRPVPEVRFPPDWSKIAAVKSMPLTTAQADDLAERLSSRVGLRPLTSSKVRVCCPHGFLPKEGKTHKNICAKHDDPNVHCDGKTVQIIIANYLYDANARYGLRMNFKYDSKDVGPVYVPVDHEADLYLAEFLVNFLLDKDADGADPALELLKRDGDEAFYMRMLNVLFGVQILFRELKRPDCGPDLLVRHEPSSN